jgi:hypothetical protein
LNFLVGEEEMVPRIETNISHIMKSLNVYSINVDLPQYFEMILEIIKIYADALGIEIIEVI